MNYSVEYGFDNGHITECKFFKLYRDAVRFYNDINDLIYKSKVCFKLHYGKKPDCDGSFLKEKECKLFSFEKGTDNSLMLDRMIINW